MTAIVKLPMKEIRRTFTAKTRPHNLHEHFMFFLCKNNANGWVEDESETVVVNTVSSMIANFSQNKITNIEHFVSVANEIYSLTKKAGHAAVISLRDVLKLLARAFGYNDFDHLVNSNRLDDLNNGSRKLISLNASKTIKNLRDPKDLWQIYLQTPEKQPKLTYFERLIKKVDEFNLLEYKPVTGDFLIDLLAEISWATKIECSRVESIIANIRAFSCNRLSAHEAYAILARCTGYKSYIVFLGKDKGILVNKKPLFM